MTSDPRGCEEWLDCWVITESTTQPQPHTPSCSFVYCTKSQSFLCGCYKYTCLKLMQRFYHNQTAVSQLVREWSSVWGHSVDHSATTGRYCRTTNLVDSEFWNRRSSLKKLRVIQLPASESPEDNFTTETCVNRSAYLLPCRELKLRIQFKYVRMICEVQAGCTWRQGRIGKNLLSYVIRGCDEDVGSSHWKAVL